MTSSAEENKKMNKIIENIESIEEHDNIYKKLDLHVTINGGLSIEELIKTIDFHKFTPESLLFLINSYVF